MNVDATKAIEHIKELQEQNSDYEVLVELQAEQIAELESVVRALKGKLALMQIEPNYREIA